MTQDITSAEAKYNFFVERVAGSKLVWGLKSKEGWANTSAADNEETDVIPFWSERAYAKNCARDDWRGYTPTEIPLAEFLEGWCVGMAEEEALAGVNWDANMIGKETEALEVAFDILNQLKTIRSAIKFKNYDSIDDFLSTISPSEE